MAREKKKAGPRITLASFCSDFFLLGLQIASGQVDLPHVEAFRRRVLALVDSMRSTAHKAGFQPADVEDAVYAVAAFLDETIHYSAWSEKAEWAYNPLQAILFSESRAGENFFARLDQIRKREATEVVEVYYYCLMLGFMGEYRLASPEQLKELTHDLMRELVQERPRNLSVHGLRPDGMRLGGGTLPTLPLAGLCLVVSALVIVLLYFLLSSSQTDALELLQQLGRN